MTRFIASLFAVVLAFAAAMPASAAFETRARAAYVFDVTTGTVLYEKNAETPLPPASMSKLMTLNMLFEALRDGRVTLETQFGVSTKARQMGGSTMFLNEQDRPTVEELIQGIVVLSGNDACVVVAEGLAGTEGAFARLMNDRAKALGMTGSTFANASGWPNPNHRMSMRDLGILATRLINEFPEYYGYFGQTEFGYDGRAPQNRFNRNPLLGLGVGADGLKTGHTEEAGYGLVGSARQGDRRIVFVLSGLGSEKERAEESERVVNWAFRQFVQRTVAKKGAVIAEADVWMGDHDRINLIAGEDISLLLPALQQEALEAKVVYRGPIQAPIAEGQAVADLVVPRPDLPEARVTLVSDRAVERGGFLPRLKTAVQVLMREYGEEAPDPN
ncbi:MAG: D-alanyl-D-alanine carboxypeptidase [Rhodobacteraceae bacterium]|nr:D-alanyl-D-alanine carboxypeptidase [Paracoccaceae bacterium]